MREAMDASTARSLVKLQLSYLRQPLVCVRGRFYDRLRENVEVMGLRGRRRAALIRRAGAVRGAHRAERLYLARTGLRLLRK